MGTGCIIKFGRDLGSRRIKLRARPFDLKAGGSKAVSVQPHGERRSKAEALIELWGYHLFLAMHRCQYGDRLVVGSIHAWHSQK